MRMQTCARQWTLQYNILHKRHQRRRLITHHLPRDMRIYVCEYAAPSNDVNVHHRMRRSQEAIQ